MYQKATSTVTVQIYSGNWISKGLLGKHDDVVTEFSVFKS